MGARGESKVVGHKSTVSFPDSRLTTYDLRLIPSTLYHFATRVLPLIPPRLGYRICEVLGVFAPHIPGWPAINANLARVLPHADQPELTRTAHQVVVHLLKNYFDLLRAHTLSPQAVSAQFTVEGVANGSWALAQGRGVLVATLHSGSFSLAFGAVASALQARLLAVVEQMHDPQVHELFNTLRQRANVDVMPIHRHAARDILAALKRDQPVVLAIDRVVGGGHVTVDFFGKPTKLSSGPATLALRTGAPLLPAYVSRLSGNRGRVVIDPPLILDRTGSAANTVQRTTQALARILEGYIRADPGQWLLTNRVWDE